MAVTHNEMSELPYIIAVDFDGTLVDDRFPLIGDSHPYVFDLLRMARERGARIILWTCRTGKLLHEAVMYCKTTHQFLFDAVNENLPEVQKMFGGSARKVYANEYWDDKAVLISEQTEEAAEDYVCCECGVSWVSAVSSNFCPSCGAKQLVKSEEEVKVVSCDSCINSGWETMDAVASCNCCDQGEFYSPRVSPEQAGEALKKTMMDLDRETKIDSWDTN